MKYIKFINLLELDAGEEAKQRGLHHIGWGRYANKSGKIIAKSVDGKLVNISSGEPDPEIDQPPKNIEKLPKEKQPIQWQNWKPKRSTDDSELQNYKNISHANSGLMGSSWETQWRKLPPGEVSYNHKATNSYVARNPNGNLAEFDNKVIAAAFAAGKQLKGYDFQTDYDGSMKRLSKELHPILQKLKSRESSIKIKNSIKSFIKDIFFAFIDPNVTFGSSKSNKKRSNKFNGFGGGSGFSGGGAGGRF